MLVVERHNQIVETLLAQESVSVAELSRLLKVSPVTVRSDLNQLAEQGRVVRTHGGATLADERMRQEQTFATRQRQQAGVKRRIGERAVELLQPAESILLDGSTTALAVGQAILRRPHLAELTVVTTGLWTALELIGRPGGPTVILTGGIVRAPTGSVTGSMVRDLLEKIHLQRAFLGAWGLTLEQGLTDSNLQEAEVKRAIAARCGELIAVVDSSKLGQVGVATYASADQISRLITDRGAAPELVEALRARGVDVLLA